MKIFTKLLLLPSLIVAACASGPSFYANPDPVGMSPQAIMSAATCTNLPTDQYGTANPIGWAIKAPTGMQTVSCGSKYASGAFYCQDPTKCGELSWSSIPSDPKDRGKTWHGIVDIIGGSVTACAEPAVAFGRRSSIDCTPIPLSFTGKGVRGVYPVVVPPLLPGTEQNSTTVFISIKPTGTLPITVGQVGFAETATP